MKKRIIVVLLFVIVIFSFLVGCGDSKVTTVEKTSTDAPQKTEKIVNKSDNKDERQGRIFNVGERVEVDGNYAITILGVTETDERNQFSEKKVEQVLIIDYLYENINDDTNDIYVSDMNFKFIDEHGNMCDTYPVGGIYAPQNTPIGAKTLTSMTIGTVEESKKIKLNYYDNMFDSKADIEFEAVIGEVIEAKLEGEAPTYSDAYSMGDIIEVKTDEGDYTVSIDNIELITERNQFADKDPVELYRIGYTFSNISMDEDLYISDMNFRVIDGNGNMAFSYPGDITIYPKDTIKGARSAGEMVFGTHTSGNTLTLCFTDNMFSNVSDFKIVLNNIKGN